MESTKEYVTYCIDMSNKINSLFPWGIRKLGTLYYIQQNTKEVLSREHGGGDSAHQNHSHNRFARPQSAPHQSLSRSNSETAKASVETPKARNQRPSTFLSSWQQSSNEECTVPGQKVTTRRTKPDGP